MRILLATLLSLVVVGCSYFQSFQAPNLPNLPYFGSSVKVSIYEGSFTTIQEVTTKRGISIWLVEEPSIPIVSVLMSWPVGSAKDPVGLEGLTKSVTYQMNEGAGDLDSLAFQTRMRELNMSFGCGDQLDRVRCSLTTLSENIDEAVDLVKLAFNSPRFDEGPFERHRREDLVAIKQRETSPPAITSEIINQTLYPSHPYARIPSNESIEARTRELALAHKDVIMTKEGLIVTVVGDISATEIAPMIDKIIASLPKDSSSINIEDVTPNPPPKEPIIAELPQPQSLITFVGQGIARDDPEFYSAVVLNHIFGGGGFESRLMKTLRIERGLTYGLSTNLESSLKHTSLWSGAGQTKNESAAEFIEVIKAEMRKISSEGVTEEEVRKAKLYLDGSYPLSFDSNLKIAIQMLGVRELELGIEHFDNRSHLIDAVTVESVNALAKKYLNPDNFTFIAVGQPNL